MLPWPRLFRSLLDILRFYQGFEINDFTGEPLNENDMNALHCDRIQRIQRVAFQHFMPTLRSFALANVGSVENPRMLKQYLQVLDDTQLRLLVQHLHLFDADPNATESRDFIFQVLLSMHEKRRSQLDEINALPL